MAGWSFYVGLRLRPVGFVVEWAPAESDEIVFDLPEDDSPRGHAADDVIEVEDFDGTYVNRMGFPPGRQSQ